MKESGVSHEGENAVFVVLKALPEIAALGFGQSAALFLATISLLPGWWRAFFLSFCQNGSVFVTESLLYSQGNHSSATLFWLEDPAEKLRHAFRPLYPVLFLNTFQLPKEMGATEHMTTGSKTDVRLPEVVDGYAAKTGQDFHGIHGIRTPLGMGHKESCPVSGSIVQPPALFAHADACLITVEVLCPTQVPDSPTLKVFEQRMGICIKL